MPPWVGPVGEPVRPEASAWSVQTVLLALGGALLAVAAVVFTVVAWGAFGIGGRAAILAGITAITFAVPALLHRRGLTSTAETIGLLGLVLLALDGYALHHAGLVPSGGARYAGIVLGTVAAIALVYPALVPLRTLRPAGLVLAHPAALLLFSPSLDVLAAYAALGLALVGADVAIRWFSRNQALRTVALVCGAFTALGTALSAFVAAAAPTGATAAPAQRLVGTLVLIGLAAAILLAAETATPARTTSTSARTTSTSVRATFSRAALPSPPANPANPAEPTNPTNPTQPATAPHASGADSHPTGPAHPSTARPAAPTPADAPSAERGADGASAVARGLAAGVAVPMVLAGPVVQWLLFGPRGWGLTGVAVAITAAAAVTLALRTPWRTGTGIASAVVAAVAGISPVTAVGFTLLAPLVSPELVWRATSVTQPVWAVPDARPSPDLVTALLALTVATGLLLLSLDRRPSPSTAPDSTTTPHEKIQTAPRGVQPTSPHGEGIARQAASSAAPLGVGAVLVLAPAAFGASIWATLLVVGLAAVAATVAGMVRRAPVLSWLGGVLAAHATVVSLASREATLVTLGLVAALYGIVAVRSTGTRQVVATGLALGTLSGWAAAVATAVARDASGWVGGPGPAGVAVGLSALVALTIARLTRDARPHSATLAAILAGVTAYTGAALAAAVPGPGGDLQLVDRSVLAILALTAAALAAVAVHAALPRPAAGITGNSRPTGEFATEGRRPSAGRWGAVAAATPGIVVAASALVPTVLAVVVGPLSWVTAVWRGAPADAAALGPALTYPGTVLDPVVLLAAAVVFLGVRWRADRRTALWSAVPALAPGLATLAPALHAPWPIAVTVLLALAATGTVTACLPLRSPTAGIPATPLRRSPNTTIAAALAATATLNALAWALADRTATLVVLTLVLAAATAVTALTRDNTPRGIGAAALTASAIALAFATGAAADLPVAYLLVALTTVLVLPGLLAAPHVVTDVLDAGAAVAGLLAFALSASAAGLLELGTTGDPTFALTTTLLGVPLGLVGLRSDRRRCGWLVPVVELVALWAWLGRAGVTVPEAYTLPAAALTAAFGLFTLRRRPAVSSWPALGPALTVATVPTLVVALAAGTLGVRALLLGIAALAVTLAGAATRRQAPFLVGAVVLSLVTARALVPVLPALADTVPTWVPLSLAGALLLAVGATYERRRRDATRLAGFIRAMH
ncbi:SCO7613 C-terminal domain-containing membrane protein [Cryptosporangium arvum]|uniref:SCO7613 C-terminal domain-containing membrane protein n=1 Tax=Cryptosporangium arvum TaxID=80871 RepID=UPI0004B01322|nr:hypothetical protein [Cryptosporangium arvum]